MTRNTIILIATKKKHPGKKKKFQANMKKASRKRPTTKKASSPWDFSHD